MAKLLAFPDLRERRTWLYFGCLLAICFALRAPADDAEMMGVTAMRRERPTIVGAGIPVAQPEAGDPTWEMPPSVNPGVFFTWASAMGSDTNYPNSVGQYSEHAWGVAANFYGAGGGVAPGVPRVDSYEALFFFTNKIVLNRSINAQVVNQSFIFLETDADAITAAYDAYAARFNVLFVSGMNNGANTPPSSPGDGYNGIGVGIISETFQTSIGPTSDGRAKPDIVAPHFCCSSFSTPYVAGGATLLLQAARANDGGANTVSIATNSATIKALLLNGAVKMTNWTNGIRRPLDARYGAGVFNIYNSDFQLRGGRRVANATNNVTIDGAHPPTSDTNNIASLRGWDFSTIQSFNLNDRVAHYYLDLPTNGGPYSATATLVWKKGIGALIDLDLFLYSTVGNFLVTNSISAVDNVEHIYIPKLSAGRYDLQVLKHGSVLPGSENYALAFDFSSDRLSIERSDSNIFVSWPASPAGFVLQSASSLDSPIVWQDLPASSVLSNGMNTAVFPASSAKQFFRLFRP